MQERNNFVPVVHIINYRGNAVVGNIHFCSNKQEQDYEGSVLLVGDFANHAVSKTEQGSSRKGIF